MSEMVNSPTDEEVKRIAHVVMEYGQRYERQRARARERYALRKQGLLPRTGKAHWTYIRPNTYMHEFLNEIRVRPTKLPDITPDWGPHFLRALQFGAIVVRRRKVYITRIGEHACRVLSGGETVTLWEQKTESTIIH